MTLFFFWPILAATIKAAGTGLTLTRTHVVVFNDLDWVPANNVQAEDRVARIGQKKNKVIYYHLIADHPIDRHLHRLILKKMKLARIAIESEIKINKNEPEKVDLQREAILAHLPKWKERAKFMIKGDIIHDESAETLVTLAKSMLGHEEERIDENDARILRLLLSIGLEEQDERCFVECMLHSYYDRMTDSEKKMYHSA
jgi:hypothetical protein